MPDDELTRAEMDRLRAEHRQISDLLALIQELTSRAVRSESIADLFNRSFPTLLRCVPFDIGVAVMLEQNLDLYVATRANAESFVNDRMVAKIRQTLEKLIPVSFGSTEIVVLSETHDLPERTINASQEDDGLRYEAYALLEQDQRTAGILLLLRSDPEFNEGEQQILSIFSTQVSLLMDTIRARERILNLADMDFLTGVWNKRHLRRQLPQELARAVTFNVPLSLLLFDIDNFKQINDVFGHVMGDVVLSELCAVVNETIRPTDVFARFGGDEFAIILPHTDSAGARAVAQRLLSRLGMLTVPTDEEASIQCSVSIGIAEYQRDDDTSQDLVRQADDLLRKADERLYLSKRHGKNRYTA